MNTRKLKAKLVEKDVSIADLTLSLIHILFNFLSHAIMREVFVYVDVMSIYIFTFL